MQNFTTRPEIRGTFGAVTSTHWIASAVGMSILEKGGNAFDAAVATGFVLQVVEPHLNGPAGDLPVIFHSARDERVGVLCAQGPAPAAATIETMKAMGIDELIPGSGLLATVVPGAFDGWLKGQLSASPRDSKDTDDFRYITFAELPPWTELHKSLMRRTVTDELFRKLKDVKSSKVCARLPLPLPLPQQQRPRAAGRLIPDTCLHPTATPGLLAVERHAGRRASAPPWRGLHMRRRRVL